MLIHEIPEGDIAFIDNMAFMRPPGAPLAQRVPGYVDLIPEEDGTYSLSGPVVWTLHGRICNVFLIHGRWSIQQVQRRP